jgi:hypothetical protein
MKRSRFSEEQIIAVLKEAEGEPVKTVCARHNVSQATYYQDYLEGKLESATPEIRTSLGDKRRGYVRRKRTLYREKKLSPQEIARFEALPGWSWDVDYYLEQSWEKNVAALKAQGGQVQTGSQRGWLTQAKKRFEAGRAISETDPRPGRHWQD